MPLQDSEEFKRERQSYQTTACVYTIHTIIIASDRVNNVRSSLGNNWG